MQIFNSFITLWFNTNTIVSILTICLFISCSTSPKKQQANKATNLNSPSDTLTLKQESTFDALNTLQMSTDERNRIFSTFPNITQPCYPPDTSFIISQSDLLVAMKEFLRIHCKDLTTEKRNELAETSVLAQDQYSLNFCIEHSKNPTHKNGPPLSGVWVLPNILGRRDLTLVW